MTVVQWLRDYSIVFMMAAFLGTLAFTFWPGRGKRFRRDGQIPLRDDRLRDHPLLDHPLGDHPLRDDF